jgi:hypothetical protein
MRAQWQTDRMSKPGVVRGSDIGIEFAVWRRDLFSTELIEHACQQDPCRDHWLWCIQEEPEMPTASARLHQPWHAASDKGLVQGEKLAQPIRVVEVDGDDVIA